MPAITAASNVACTMNGLNSGLLDEICNGTTMLIIKAL